MIRISAVVLVALIVVGMSFAAPPRANALEWWTGKSDQYVWEWFPDLTIRGIEHETWGCPICGTEIFEGRGHYPWIWHPDLPYKIECPICHRVFPTNDYHKWMLGGRKEKLDTTQKYVDDGNGYVGPDGTKYRFVKYALGGGHKLSVVDWTYYHGMRPLARAYTETGEEKYAHKCALIVARIATEYPSLNADRPDNLTEEQIKKLPYIFPPQGAMAGIGNYQVEAYFMKVVLQAYRQIYPYLEAGGDAELRAFLAEKGIDDVKSLIQWDLCHEYLLGALEGNFVSGLGTLGMMRDLAESAIAWDFHDPSKGATTEYIIQWIATVGPKNVRDKMYNGFDRDGFTSTAGLGYNFAYGMVQIAPLADILRRGDVDLYAWLRVRETIRAPIKTIVAGKWTPTIGDAGSSKGMNTMGFWRAGNMGPALMSYGDPLLAKVLALKGGGEYQERVDEIVAEVGKDITWESRNFPVFGLGILESGKGDFARALTCYYGGTTAHCHWDRLTFSLFNKRGPVTPDLGYPYMGSPSAYAWTSSTPSHNTVMVDASKHYTKEPGYIKTFSVTPTAQLLEAGGEAAYPGLVSTFNRALIWVDVDQRNSYLVDVFRVAGGSQHDYGLHGTSAAVAVEGLSLSEQQGGTLAGPDVEYLDFYDHAVKSYGYRGSGFQYLRNVEEGSAQAGFVVTWNHRIEKTPFLRAHVPAGMAEQVFFADGLPPFGKPGEDELRYMFLRNGSSPPWNEQFKDGKRVFPVGDLQSTFVTVLEPLLDDPFIVGVEHIRDVKGLGPADVALAIKRSDGATDVLICRDEAGATTAGDIQLEGRVAICTLDPKRKPTRLALLDGTSLSFGMLSISVGGPSRGTVSSVDYDAMTVTVAEKLPAGTALAGKTIIFSTPPRSASFVIDSIRHVAEGSAIKLRGTDAILYRGGVEAVDEEKATVVLDSMIDVLHSGIGFAGKRLYNEDRSVGMKISRFQRRHDPNHPWPPFGGTAFVEEGQGLQQAFTDRDGDGRVMAYVYDFGPGDAYYMTQGAYLERED